MPASTLKLTFCTASTPPNVLLRSDTSSSAISVRSRISCASVGTRPLGRKIIDSIKIVPKATVSQPSNVVSACGSAVSSTAPITEPYTEAMPPTTTMVTSSIECENSAVSGVTKPT